MASLHTQKLTCCHNGDQRSQLWSWRTPGSGLLCKMMSEVFQDPTRRLSLHLSLFHPGLTESPPVGGAALCHCCICFPHGVKQSLWKQELTCYSRAHPPVTPPQPEALQTPPEHSRCSSTLSHLPINHSIHSVNKSLKTFFCIRKLHERSQLLS